MSLSFFADRTPSAETALPAAVSWVEQLLLGQLGTIIAIVAVAFVGMSMLSGRMALRDGVRVVLGCFILFGAPLIAHGFIDMVRGSGEITLPPNLPPAPPPKPAPTKAPQFDPYAGASLPG
ncbi:MAG: hypothetical protein RLY97_1450 [Pseudomonadota bacterium]|jgi:type IV secretory pathway VirB2 component (pilin)